MKKPLVLLVMCAVLFSAGIANAMIFEYQKGLRHLAAGDEFELLFNQFSRHRESPSQRFALRHDATVGWDNMPFLNAFLKTGLFSAGRDWGPPELQPLAMKFDAKDTFNEKSVGDIIQIFKFDLSDTAFIDDPYGIMPDNAGIACKGNNGGLVAITRQGVGGGFGPPDNDSTPVPEPATMLMIGTGLIGLAFAGRKKMMD